jgi:hypothetical protein
LLAPALLDHLHQALALLLQAGLVFLEAGQAGLQRQPPRLEQLLLRLHMQAHHGVAALRLDVRMKTQHRLARLLGQQARLGRAQRQVVLADRLKVGTRRRLLEHHQHIALAHHRALLHQHLAHDAALQMLHRLALGIDGHHTGRRYAFINGSQRRPQQQAQQGQPQRVAPDACSR